MNKTPFTNSELEYSDLIAQIGSLNRDNLIWLASAVCSKNPSICNHIRRISGMQADPAIQPFRIIMIFFRRLYRNYLLCPLFLRDKLKRQIARMDKINVFLTLYKKESFFNVHESDFFWGRLIEKASEGKAVVAVGYTIYDEYYIVNNLKKSIQRDGIIICPLELFMTNFDCVKALVITFIWRINIGKAFLGDKNISRKIRRMLSEERFNGEIFQNLCRYYAFKRLSKRLAPEKIYYPWENHSWEKLLLLAVKKNSPSTRTIGFQHGTVPLFYINHFPAKKELEYALFPDRIVTTGIISLELLNRYGHFPENCLQVGCALRYEYLYAANLKRSRLSKSIILGLATPVEMDDTLYAIETVADLLNDYKIKIRTKHFVSPDKIFVALGNLASHLRFSEEGMGRFLHSCDIIVYTNTTVGMEAINIGTPAIYLDTGKGVLGDPMFNNTALKWIASNPAELERAIQEIKSLPLDGLNLQRRKARKYVENYFCPITEKGIQAFLKDQPWKALYL